MVGKPPSRLARNRSRLVEYAAAYTFPAWLMRHPVRRRAELMREVGAPGSELPPLLRAYAEAEAAWDAETMAWLDRTMAQGGAPVDWRTVA